MIKKLVPVAAIAAVAIGVASCAGGKQAEPPASSLTVTATSIGQARDGWEWHAQGGVAFQTPDDFTFGWPPYTNWCITDGPPEEGTKLVIPMHSWGVESIACGSMPREYFVPWVRVELDPESEEPLKQIAAENWADEKVGGITRHEAQQPGPDSDELGPIAPDPLESYERFSRSVGPITVTVGMPSDAVDETLAAGILETVVPISTTPLGCPSVATPGAGANTIEKDEQGDLVICQYLAGHREGDGQSADRPQGLHVGEHSLSGNEATSWLSAVYDAPKGLGPNNPDNCAPGLEDGEFIQVRSATGMLHVSYVGCRSNGITGNGLERNITRENCGPIFSGGTVRITFLGQEVGELCMPDDVK